MPRPTASQDDEKIEIELGHRAIERIFREHNETLVGFLRVRLNSDADAREAAQDAYVRLLRLDQPNRPSFIRAYLFKTANNVALDLIRRRKTRSEVGLTGEEPLEATQERALGARQELQIVERALNGLPPRCREAFILHRQEGWSSSAIANGLGVSERMVRNYLVRALEHLEHALQKGGTR